METEQRKRILVTGATGYVGGRLVSSLLERGYAVRCMARDPRKLMARWDMNAAQSGSLEIVQGDVTQPETLDPALEGVHCAYYLIHAMGDSKENFEERDLESARAFAESAERQGVRRIIYLGGLGRRRDPRKSAHLESRHQTGDALRSAQVPVTELRAAIIIGSGSASFEILRYLVESLPIILCPKWAEVKTQPIAIDDVLTYLVKALETPETAGLRLDIGGADIVSFREALETYADVRGLKRTILRTNWLPLWLAGRLVNIITPLPSSLILPLIEGMRTKTVCENEAARRLMPFSLLNLREAIVRACQETEENRVPSHWSTAYHGAIPRQLDAEPLPKHGLLQDKKRVSTPASSAALHRALARIGGKIGWYYADWLWDLRGGIDRALGGVGDRRGRRSETELRIGDIVDFWRVEDFTPDRLLLRAEMKVPGNAWLEFRIREEEGAKRALEQNAYYQPASLWGYLYWYAMIPFHYFIFRGMAQRIVAWAEAQDKALANDSPAPSVVETSPPQETPRQERIGETV